MSRQTTSDISGSSLPLGHSLVLSNDSEKPKRLVTYSIPRSSLFNSLNTFLPQFKQSCEEVEREIAETGATHFAVEELISDSEYDSSDESSESEMCVEKEESSVPSVEMHLAVAPMDTVEMIEKAEEELPDPVQSSQNHPLVKEL